MSCIPSTYNASGVLVGCTEQELTQIISTQLYTVFALGTGLYLYKTFTAENWVDIAVQIGWGCVSTFTHAKRFTVRHVIPGIHVAGSFVAGRIASLIPGNSESEVSVEDDHCYVRVIKDGAELHEYSSIFGLIQHLTEQMDAKNQEEEQEQEQGQEQGQGQRQGQEQGQEQDSDDVVEVPDEDEGNPNQDTQDPAQDPAQDPVPYPAQDPAQDPVPDPAQDPVPDSEFESESESHDATDADIKEHLLRIDNHVMQFDFVMCQVPTLQSATSTTPQVMHVVKYDGFPRDSDGSYFYDRKFVPVNHRMMEIVLQHGDSEHELDLSSPDNFYVLGNKLLDPAFLKWFMRKNHNIDLNIKVGDVDATTSDASYTIKCIDNNATLHTLFPHNCIRVSETGFEVHDSRLI